MQVTGNLAVLKLEEDYSTSSGVGYSSTYIEHAAASSPDERIANMNLNTNKYNQKNLIPVIPNAAAYYYPNFTTGTYLCQFPEYQSSVFKRSFLYGLVILCNTIATTGEFVAGGAAAEKILTDFNVDETSVDARDYLLYEPAGNSFRWFDINSSAPISTIDLDVRYVDKYQKRHPLPLPVGTTGSVKLHFRRKYS